MSLRPATHEQETVQLVEDPILSRLSASRMYNDLTESERSVADLGVDPNAFHPIQTINELHFQALQKKNLMSPTLERALNNYKELSK